MSLPKICGNTANGADYFDYHKEGMVNGYFITTAQRDQLVEALKKSLETADRMGWSNLTDEYYEALAMLEGEGEK